jgi:GNAT superfamily N-acetyltransferase
MATSAPASTLEIRRLDAVDAAQFQALADVLIDCVEGGASVSFMLPMTLEKSLAFWRKVANGVARGERVLLVAEDAQGIVGTVQVILEQPENQPHRADVAKMLVHRRARRQGADAARRAGKTLLVLDTGDATAARLYERLGWQAVGAIPRYALMPDGGDCATTFYYRELTA